jgi:hypothetical protein
VGSAKQVEIGTLGEAPQQLCVELASGAVMVDVDADTGLSRPLEGCQALQWLPIRQANDLSVSLEYEPLVGGAEPTDARRRLTHGRYVDFPADCRVLDVGA